MKTEIQTKKCSKCGQIKLVTEFNKSSGRKDLELYSV